MGDEMQNEKRQHIGALREGVGIFVAAFCVIAYIGIGFVSVLIFLMTGKLITFPADWSAAMLSLSSACVGYLVSANQQPKHTAVTATTTTLPNPPTPSGPQQPDTVQTAQATA